VPVVIRQRNADSVLVEGALAPGDLVIIEGVQTLRPSAAVEIVTDASATTDTAPDGAVRRDI
jgi:hypothetical protein